MYYPKSQIKTALYTNGDQFARFDTQQEYRGYYWKNSKGQFFTGKNPNDTPSVALVPLKTNNSEEPSLPKNYSSWTNKYPNEVVDAKPGLSPQITHPKPTQDDYKLGTFTRYFTKKTNQSIYYETSKSDFDKLNKKDSSIKWQLYQPISLTWQITGDEDQVYKTNRNIVLITEKEQMLPGFRKIFRENYLQYYKQ